MEIIGSYPEGERLMEVAGFAKGLIVEDGANVGVYIVEKNLTVPVLKGTRLDIQCAYQQVKRDAN